MTDQDKKPEPWEETFKEDQPDQYSRTEHRRKSQRVNWTIGVLVVIVVVLSFVPIYEYLQTLNKPTNAEQTWSSASTSKTKVTDNAKSESLAKKRSSESRAKSESSVKAAEASSKAAVAESKAAESSSKAAQAQAEKAASEKAASEKAAREKTAAEQSSKKPDDGNKQYATVAAGQGAYRVATNAGISQAKLQELNPGVNLANVSAGQQLRVK